MQQQFSCSSTEGFISAEGKVLLDVQSIAVCQGFSRLCHRGCWFVSNSEAALIAFDTLVLYHVS
jgi:hypothetical protein